MVAVPVLGDAVVEGLDSRRHVDHDRHSDHRIDHHTVWVLDHGDGVVEEVLYENREKEEHWDPNPHHLLVAFDQRDPVLDLEEVACCQILPASSKQEHC